mmetsp:Transcript_36162/g.78930  ORF Transcript_36162/g.78930 Transcript_36162/m.78930 type:complete len:237 (-) Transcript_36162:379-1089(-)
MALTLARAERRSRRPRLPHNWTVTNCQPRPHQDHQTTQTNAQTRLASSHACTSGSSRSGVNCNLVLNRNFTSLFWTYARGSAVGSWIRTLATTCMPRSPNSRFEITIVSRPRPRRSRMTASAVGKTPPETGSATLTCSSNSDWLMTSSSFSVPSIGGSQITQQLRWARKSHAFVMYFEASLCPGPRATLSVSTRIPTPPMYSGWPNRTTCAMWSCRNSDQRIFTESRFRSAAAHTS